MFAALAAVTTACASPEQKLERYYESGQEFLEKNDLGKANIQFRNALKIDEAHVPSLLGLAVIAEEKNDLKAMFGLYQGIARLDPDNLKAHIQLGKLYLIGSDETTAMEEADKALTLAPDNLDAMSLKAGVLMRIGDSVQATELARKVVAVDRANPEATVVLATDLGIKNDFEGALAEIDSALAIDPKLAVLQLLRIRILGQLNRTDDIVASYKNLVDLFPEEVAYRRALASAYILEGDLDNALLQLEGMVELQPDNLDTKLDIVRIVKSKDGDEAAEKRLREFADAESDNFDLKFALSDFMREQKAYTNALAVVEPLIRSEDRTVAMKALNKTAAIHMINEQRELAEPLVDQILTEDANNTQALLKRAGLQIDDGELDAAIANLRTAVNNEPDLAEAMVLMSTAFERQGNIQFARAELAKAFDVSEQSVRIGRAYSSFLLRHNNVARAEEVLEQVLAKNPRHLDTLKRLASIRLQQQDWSGAEEIAELIEDIGANGDDEAVRDIRTVAYSGLGEHDRIIELLNDDRQAGPLASRPLATLVGAYVNSNRTAEAKTLLENVIASDQENYPARILLAQVVSSTGDQAGAEDILLEATKADPTRATAYEILYRYYLANGKRDSAESLIDEGLSNTPDSDALQFYKADVLLSSGAREEALEIYDGLIQRRPQDRIIANNFVSLIGELRDDQASLDRALEVAQTLKDETNPVVMDTVGWAYYRAGQQDKALEYLTKAAEGAPEHPEILYHLGMAQFAVGGQEDWRATLNKALEKGGENFRYAPSIQAVLDRQ
ncbi:MAG: hypothetical protein DHS20C05_00230 [Hyphococcus sp.]|nr:MAG: hypothetical protein DHS20C05_00230 [Marinicaulis sp.]